MNGSALKIFSGNANIPLAREICDKAGITLGHMDTIKFSNENIKVTVRESVRGADIFVVQPSCSPVNEGVMELLIIIDALKRSSANRITAVIPYFGYGRQDRKDQPAFSLSD